MKMIKFNGETLSVTDWAKRVGISRQAMARKISKAQNPQEIKKALTTGARQGERTDIARKKLKRAKALQALQSVKTEKERKAANRMAAKVGA